MSPLSEEQSSKRRRSERRRLKLLRNLDQFKIANPFRRHRPQIRVPQSLASQLRRLDFLSTTTVKMLHFDSSPDMYSTEALEAAAAAILLQENRWLALHSLSKHPITETTHTELSLEENASQLHPERDDLPFNHKALCSDEICLFPPDFYSDPEIDLNFRTQLNKSDTQVLLQDDFLSYFVK